MRVKSATSKPDIFEEMRQRVRDSFDRLSRGERVVKPLTPEQIEKLAERSPVQEFDAWVERGRPPDYYSGGG